MAHGQPPLKTKGGRSRPFAVSFVAGVVASQALFDGLQMGIDFARQLPDVCVFIGV
jgi:hypothetical protein